MISEANNRKEWRPQGDTDVLELKQIVTRLSTPPVDTHLGREHEKKISRYKTHLQEYWMKRLTVQ